MNLKSSIASVLAFATTFAVGVARAAEVSSTMPNPLTTVFTVGDGNYFQSGGQENWTLDIHSGGVLEITSPQWETVFQQNVRGTSTVNIATGGYMVFTNATGKGKRLFVGNAGEGNAVGILNLNGGTLLGDKLEEFSLGRDGAKGYLNINGGVAKVGSLVMGSGGGTAIIDFSADSTGILSVVGKDVAFFERLFISGQLTHNGISSGNFTDHFHTDGYSVALLDIPLPEPPPPLPPLVDPRFPAEWHALQKISHEEWTRWPRARIQQLEEERDRLLARISALPQHDPQFRSDHLGYHSLFEDPGYDGLSAPHQLDIKMGSYRLDSISLVPAFNPRDLRTYSFPKRFKIEVLNSETDTFEEVVNWMDEDFPEPGLYPVFFADINRAVRQVRISVPRVAGESGAAYFALGEIYLLRRRGGQMGDNMVSWADSTIEASDSFTMPPIWDTQYLGDGRSGFGLPLSDEKVAAEDLLIRPENGARLSDRVQLTLDLGRERSIGPIDFWPASAPYLMALPSFGFPQKITVELSKDPDFKKVGVFGEEGSRIHGGELLSIKCKGYRARYIRITMEELSEYKGEKFLGLGEILVSEYEEPLSINCKVTAQGIPDEYLDQLPRLVDGCSWQRRILPPGEWIKGLAKRRPLDRRLVEVEQELGQARANWRLLQQRIGIWGGSAIVVGLFLGMVLQRRQRHRILDRLKWRIARDLHDDVGSSLGSISLVAERLEQDVKDEVAKDDLADLSLLAREASASLRDVVWVIDRTTIRLPELVQKLVERAQRILSGVELSVEVPRDCPDMVVPLAFKRHLIMFFKEAVHNCARHARASRVQIVVSTKDRQLCIRVRDNGCGFDPAALVDGWGLESMQKRTHELGGTMMLDSQPGQGTTVELTVPLTALLENTDYFYKTSN